MIGIGSLIMVAISLWFLISLNDTLIPISINIPVELELEIEDNIAFPNGTQFKFVIEPVENGLELSIPMPETTVIEVNDAINLSVEFSGIEFMEVGSFEYRISQLVSDNLEKDNGIGRWLIDESIFYITVTIDENEGGLLAGITITRDDNAYDEIVFINVYEAMLLGLWGYGYGESLERFNVREIEFLENGILFSGELTQGDSWELNADGQLVVNSPSSLSSIFTLEIEKDMLVLVDAGGSRRTFIQEGVEPADYRNWVIRAYLDYFEIKASYRIINNHEFFGDEFSFVAYLLGGFEEGQDTDTLTRRALPYYWEIVVLKDNEVVDVIHHVPDINSGWHIRIVAVDVNFDGSLDILIWNDLGARPQTYSLYMWRNGEFSYVPCFSEIINPLIDHENQTILSVRDPLGGGPHSWNRVIYQLVDDEYVRAEELFIMRRPRSDHWAVRWEDQILIDGEWQLRESIYFDEFGHNHTPEHPNPYWQNHWFGERWNNALSVRSLFE